MMSLPSSTVNWGTIDHFEPCVSVYVTSHPTYEFVLSFVVCGVCAFIVGFSLAIAIVNYRKGFRCTNSGR